MNGFILVFDMVLVLAAERRLVADRAAAGGPARSRQSRPVAGCPPAADGRPVAECPARSRRPNTMIGFVCGSAPDARCCTYDSAPRTRRQRG